VRAAAQPGVVEDSDLPPNFYKEMEKRFRAGNVEALRI